MHEQLEMLKRYPLLLPTTKDYTAYEGFIRAGEEEFPIGLQVPNYPSLADLSLCCSWKLSYILHGTENDLRDCITSYPTLLEYLDMLKHLIESRLQSPEASALLRSGRRPPHSVYTRVLDDISAVGPDNVVDISPTLQEVRLSAVDDVGRRHLLTVGGLAGEPPRYSVVAADVPLRAVQNLQQEASLLRLYRAFKEQLHELQAFWEVLEQLDEHCWIVDPDVPRRSHTHRRIVLGSNVSVQVMVDPYNARSRPDIKFLGSEMAIRPLHRTLSETVDDWSPRSSFVNNLLDALGLTEFPRRPAGDGDDEAALQLVRPGECCVCYMTRADDGHLPSEACDNTKCGSHFHRACLHQWLSMVPTNRTSFNRVYGQCPNCDWAISCPTIPDVRLSSS